MAEAAKTDLYERDFYAWTQDQAARLRALGRDNRFDVAHVAEEIEDLGRSQLNAVDSHLEKLLMHLVKLAWSPATDPRAHWREEVLEHQSEAQRAFSAAMRQKLNLDRIWRKAIRRAHVALVDRDEPGLPRPSTPPFTLDDLLTEDFDLDAAEARVRAALSDEGASPPAR
jgi:hypothetical protein